jgi:glycosyltransferase involved in cell wall biosynthesis
MKKILWLTSWYPNKTDRFTGDFIQRHALAASQYSHIIVLHVAKAEAPFFPEGTFEEISVKGNLTEHILYYRCQISWKPLNRLVSTCKYFWHFSKLIRIYVRQGKKPVLAHVHVPIKAGLLGLWLRRKFGVEYLLTEHYGIYNSVVRESFGQRSRLFRYYTKKIVRQAAILIPVSRYLGEAICSLVIRRPYTVVFNTVDTTLFRLEPARREKFRFVHVSGMEPVKQVDRILSVFRKAWDENQLIELMLVGKPDKEAQQLAVQTGLVGKAIFFAGEVEYPVVAQQLQQAQAMILFSKMENMPCVILEALCSGLPVLATRVGGISEVVSAANGILIEPGDELALYQGILSMAQDYERFDRQQISGDAQRQFSYQAIGKQIDDLYSHCLSPSALAEPG